MEHPKRVHSEELSSESDWQTSESKKKRRKKKKELGTRAASPMDSGPIPPPAERPEEEDVSNPTRPSGYPGTSRFKVKTSVPEPFELVTALSNDPRQIPSKPQPVWRIHSLQPPPRYDRASPEIGPARKDD